MMKLALATGLLASSLACSIAAFAQTPTAPAQTPQAQTGSTSATTGSSGKRQACQSTVQSLKGQEKRDQLQLCLAQARVDCLKQAIDQKVTGAQRKEFVKSCMG
jgi:anti-sigma28 factor (negative regulator of flagellin synthesis)